jgi:hypothetical protein
MHQQPPPNPRISPPLPPGGNDTTNRANKMSKKNVNPNLFQKQSFQPQKLVSISERRVRPTHLSIDVMCVAISSRTTD